MEKKKLSAVVIAALMSAAGAAGAAQLDVAAGPLQLSDRQMDSVAAGAQTSTAGGTATASYGTVTSWSQSRTVSSGPIKFTSASSTNLAIGDDATASANAGSTF